MYKRNNSTNLFNKTPIEIYDMVLKGQLSRFPASFWDEVTAKEIISYLYKGYSKKQLLKIDFRKDLKEKHAIGAYDVFSYSTYRMLIFCFPKLRIKPWELSRVPEGCWNDENIKEAILYMFKKEKMNTKESICEKFSANLLRKYGFKSIMEKYTLLEILNLVVPEYNIMEKDVNKPYAWNNESAVNNIKYLLEEVLKWDHEDICENISTRIFEENGLKGLLSKFCNNSVYEALQLAYPGVFKKSDLRSYRENKRI